ncbi:hypothetical protein CO007_04080 [Candidatus Roizmanbacteria bacterium CG_4_8_14_3_um_filter_36_10]|uniref:Kazal-like domain-containing protein n=1 Tax=Candidatus Roizmanbacteria bacterium CG_4_8_14_3_um_filter_36_10 TaxID=1974834 RepID=A0A2M8GLW3_9BACT|nr:MAG: hypothetical protein CO007_04080 [Candidatus Roizmanbacteria bacterium CG_4_8_14_3_um_filter_36_10]
MKDCRRCFLVFIFVLLSVICGYFFFQNYQLKKQIKDFQPVLFPSSSPFPTGRVSPPPSERDNKESCKFRPQVCTMECINPPPYICGSNGKSYCSPCQACADEEVQWFRKQNQPCQ